MAFCQRKEVSNVSAIVASCVANWYSDGRMRVFTAAKQNQVVSRAFTFAGSLSFVRSRVEAALCAEVSTRVRVMCQCFR